MLSATMLKTPFHLIQTIDAECATVAEKLTKSAKQIKTKEDSRNVARVSAENKTLALAVADTFFELGKEGVISIEENSRPEIEIAKTNGLRIDQPPAIHWKIGNFAARLFQMFARAKNCMMLDS